MIYTIPGYSKPGPDQRLVMKTREMFEIFLEVYIVELPGYIVELPGYTLELPGYISKLPRNQIQDS